jgi:hypothetical protein
VRSVIMYEQTVSLRPQDKPCSARNTRTGLPISYEILVSQLVQRQAQAEPTVSVTGHLPVALIPSQKTYRCTPQQY